MKQLRDSAEIGEATRTITCEDQSEAGIPAPCCGEDPHAAYPFDV